MSELRKKIHEILKGPQLVSLATITEEGKPWVRYVIAITSENLTVNFSTFLNARKAAQIKNNSEVHITCGITNLNEMKPYLQIQGKAVLNTSEEVRYGFWNSALEKIFEGPDDPNYGIIQVTPYCIEYCTPGSFEPEVWSYPTA
ncbi:MAG: pyridoxamine 5'-phosphate oxidase family protein [Candidatus Omnitrophota bacterium]